MSPSPTSELRLSILEPFAGRAGGRLSLRQGAEAGTTYVALFEPCPQPRCGCASVWVHCRPLAPDGTVVLTGKAREFWFEAGERKLCVSPELERAPESLRLGQAIQAELRDDDWAQLYRWFRSAKQEVIRKTPIDQVSVEDLPETEGGRMIGFVEVFPFCLLPEFTIREARWAVDDQYCVQPDCRCKETVLSFFNLDAAKDTKTITPRDMASLRYDYASGGVTVEMHGPTGAPPPEALLAALKRAHPTLDADLRARHNSLRSLYGRAEKARLQGRLGSPPKAVQPVRLRAPKVGRNDPCPCGSGKKYKHCCLGKK